MMFYLQPFPSSNPSPNLSMAGDIARNSNKLSLRYQVTGKLEEIALSCPLDTAIRQHQLWEETCFEFFLGVKNSEEYWEFNLSPSGNWNVYHFDRYRQGMQEELAFESLPFTFEIQANSLTLTLDLDLSKIVAEEQLLDVGITTVIESINGEVTYWALTHQGAEADFHLRESFIIEL